MKKVGRWGLEMPSPYLVLLFTPRLSFFHFSVEDREWIRVVMNGISQLLEQVARPIRGGRGAEWSGGKWSCL